MSLTTLQNLTYFFAGLKIATSFIWMITVALKTDMGVAWHRSSPSPTSGSSASRTAASPSARSSR